MYDRDSDDMKDNFSDNSDNFSNEEPSFDFPIEDFDPEALDPQSSDGIPQDDEQIQNIQYSKYKPKKSGSSLGFVVVILLFGIVLVGALLYFYSDSIPFLSGVAQKLNVDNVETIKESDVNKLDDIAVSDTDDELQKMLEDASETGVSVDGQENAIPKPNAQPEGQAPGMANQPGNNGLPPLPNAQKNPATDMQNPTDVAVQQKYTGAVGRVDPFNPTGAAGAFEIMVPPNNPVADIDAAGLLTLRIAGIMYTPESPSAIINIEGQDQLVRKGDKFDWFRVTNITKDKVTVQSGKNTFTASVGEIISIDSMSGINGVPNLNKKFAGPYSKGKDVIIEINTLN